MNVKQGDTAKIIESIDGLNVGKIVEVCTFQGHHSRLGPIWRVRVLKGDQLVTEYGGVGITCDCADAWLEPHPPVEQPAPHEEMTA